MIIQLQALNRILAGKDYQFIANNFTVEDFLGYEDEFNFIVDHYNKHGNIPDEATFLSKFPNFELAEVTESDDYIIDMVHENTLYVSFGKHLTEAAELMKTDSNKAVEYMMQVLETVKPSYSIKSTDVIAEVDNRVKHSSEVNLNKADWFIPTGFDELDTDINGFQRGDELVVLFARTNQGKSWIAEKIASYMTEIGYRTGYFSPEMNVLDIGYRFDTLHGHISNNTVRLGRFDDEFTIENYSEYAETVKNITGKLFVTRPKDFARKITVSKLRQWITQDNLDALFIDGITYLTDERFKRGDNKTISLTNISEDLMDLSAEMHIPIIVVVQANRGGVVDKHSTDTPELENIRDSDGIAQNASIVYAVRQVKSKDNEVFLLLDNKKMRGGEVGKSYKYRWSINDGKFEAVSDADIDFGDDEDETPKSKKSDKTPTASGRKRKTKEAEDDY